jgi:hypothetical protein
MNNKSSGFPDPSALNHYKLNQNYLPLFLQYLKYAADRTTSQGYTTIQKNTLRFLKYLQRRRLLLENLTGNDGVHNSTLWTDSI